MALRKAARIGAIVCLILLVLNFFTLENREVTTNPAMQALGRTVGIAALVGLAASLVALLLGRRVGRSTPSTATRNTGMDGGMERATRDVAAEHGTSGAAHDARTPTQAGGPGGASRGRRFRAAKVVAALLVLAVWFVGLPVYAYRNLVSRAPDFEPGPWMADAVLSVFAVITQVITPTPVALAFWPSLIGSSCLLFSRRDRPLADVIFGLVAVVPAAAVGYMLLAGVQV